MAEAAAPTGGATKTGAGPLARRYAWGVAAVAAPLMLLIGALALAQFTSQRATRLEFVARDLSDLRIILDALVKPAQDHVAALRRLAEDHLTGRLPTPASPLRDGLRQGGGETRGALLLETATGAPAAPLAGNLHGRADLIPARGDDMTEIDMALGLFEPMRAAHLSNPHLRWSYYFSGRGDFLVEYPFAPAGDFMRAARKTAFEDYLPAMFNYPVFRDATPGLNPTRSSYWTPIYLDAAGAGWMVSHAAPVYAGNAFAGMVGADLLLDFLGTALRERARPPGRVLLVDGRARVLADSAGPLAPRTAPPSLAAALPPALAAIPTAELLRPVERPHAVEAWVAMALPLTETPWSLVFLAPEAEITRLVLDGLWPYALLLGGVVATLVLAQHLLRRNFVGPAIALAARVQDQGADGALAVPPDVPRFWRPWFGAVDAAFQSGRRHLAQARDEEARKTAILEAAFDSVITTDEQGRVVEMNAGAESTFGLDRQKALGRRVGDLIVPPKLRARHDAGMARYVATGERHVLGRRIEVEGLRADGATFPVELAITEVRLADRRLFTAYLRDISDRKRAEQALQDSERRYRTVVEDQTELISRYDPDFRLTFANAAHGRFFGFDPEEPGGRRLSDFVPEALWGQVRAELAALTPDDPIRQGVSEIAPGGDPAPRAFAWTTRALFDDEGTLTGYLGVGRDITEARRVEQALRDSEARFVGAAESLPDGLLILDPDDRIVFFNHRHRDLLPPALHSVLRTGIAFADFIREGAATGPVYHPDMGEDYAERRLAARSQAQTEREHKHADGRWVRVREGRMPDGGRVLLTVDITARKEAEDTLRQNEARYRAVVEGQTEFILRLRPDGVLTFVNDAYCRHRGRTRQALLDDFNDVAHYPLEQRQAIHDAWAALTPRDPTVTYAFEPGAPGERHEEWIDTGIFDEDGVLVEIQAVGRDITERKLAEAEIRRQREAAHRSERLASMGSLLAGVAHELNNPLSVVVGRAIMLEEDASEPGVRASLVRLRAAAERCARIVRTFLALARDEPRQAPRPVDLGAVLDGVLDLAYGLRSAGVEIAREEDGPIPAVMADADQLGQVFLNLVVNAQQALEPCPPPRRLWLRLSAGSGAVRIEVADNGPGVPREIRDRIFDPFFTTKPVGAGTGLGLSTCHGIVSAYCGTLEILDRPGGGARFVVTLPAAADAANPAKAAPPARIAGAGGDILVVDDEPEVVAMLEEALARDGHRVATAPDGEAALAMLRDGWFDAVLCDLRMPRLDGLGLLRALEVSRPALAARLLLMTGDGLRAGANPALRGRLLEKPLDPDEVRRRVRAVAEGAPRLA